jgi:hypothetical protein
MHSWRRFLSALVLAPLAGGLAGFLTGIGFVLFIGKESERNWRDASTLGSFLGFWSLLICLAYVLIIGSAAYAWARLQQRPLSLAVALIVGFVVGVVPFTIISFRKGEGLSREALLFPLLALICSIATAWTFWRVALAERTAV